MYTQCPQCLTIFSIEEDALRASLGIVHCGQCGQRFDALRTLSHALPAGHGPPSQRDTSEHAPTLTGAVPPAARGSAARQGRDENAGVPAAPTPDDLAEAPAAGEGAPPEAVPDAGDSDWFAEFETALTGSLRSEATAAPDDAFGGHAWQVDELPAQDSLPEPATPVTFGWAGPGFGAADVLADPNWGGIETRDAGNGGASESPAPVVPPDPHRLQETPHGDAGAANRGESGHPNGQTPPIPLAASGPGAPDPAGRGSIGADVSSGAPDGPPRLNRLLAHEAVDAGVTSEAGDAPPMGEGIADAEVVSDPVEPPAPVYVRPRRRLGAATVAWVLGCLALVAVLAAQLAWIKRADLFRDPATHAWMARACQAIDCRLPPIRDIAKLELVSRDVRPDPHAPGALTITATLRNGADFRQPWPVVVVELTDLGDNAVAMRRFLPAEYMPDAARRAAGIAAGATSAIAFEVADPGKRAVAFRFSFE